MSGALALLYADGSAQKAYIEDVFLVNLRTGNAAVTNITGGPNLAAGGMVATKARDTTSGWRYTNTARGVTNSLDHTTAAQATEVNGLTAFNADGFTIGSDSDYNTSSKKFVDYLFKEAPKFFKQALVTKTAGSNVTVDLSTLGTVGMVRVKCTSAIGSWYVWHRSLTAGKLLDGTNVGETTAGQITVSGTTLTLVDGVIADGTYHIDAFAHDASPDGLIQCGAVVGTAITTTGWETQLLIAKPISTSGAWSIQDSMRGLTGDGAAQLFLGATTIEASALTAPAITSTSFKVVNAGTDTQIFVAVRRGPMRSPTAGTQVFNAKTRSGTGASASVTGVGFPPDLVFTIAKAGTATAPAVNDKLRGTGPYLVTSAGSAEVAGGAAGVATFDMDGFSFGAGSASGGSINLVASTYVDWFFRRWPGVLDQICYNGNGSAKTELHNLAVAPEFWFGKRRDGTGAWTFGSTLLAATEKIVCPSPAGKVTDATAWNSTYPTATDVSLGSLATVNSFSGTHMMNMVATLAGISKVFGYTGNGSSQTINCGFVAGARFVLIVRTDPAGGDFYVWDTVRGIIAGNDPHLSLNTAAIEVTTDDSIDPDASGFIVNQVAATNINVSSATYIGFAFA